MVCPYAHHTHRCNRAIDSINSSSWLLKLFVDQNVNSSAQTENKSGQRRTHASSSATSTGEEHPCSSRWAAKYVDKGGDYDIKALRTTKAAWSTVTAREFSPGYTVCCRSVNPFGVLYSYNSCTVPAAVPAPRRVTRQGAG